MSGSEILLFLTGFGLGAGCVFFALRLRSQTEEKSRELIQQQF